MIITYYGLSCFKVSSGEFVLAFDPPSKKSALKSPRFQADAVFISHNHDNHNGYEAISAKEGSRPLKISGPGEYETGQADIEGILSFHDDQSGKKSGLNTIYAVNLEEIRLCHMGDFGETELRPETREALGRIDVLFLPIGGKDVIGPENAVKIANQIEPRIIIPMHYEKKDLNDFLKEIGQSDAKPENKLTLKKKDLPENKTNVLVLSPAVN
jgi:L-ascorbate metabolism protein UlaG (beta-lactamase superfamily)